MKEHDFATKMIDGLVEKLERLEKLEAAPLHEEVIRLREGISNVLNNCWPNATTMMKKLKELIE